MYKNDFLIRFYNSEDHSLLGGFHTENGSEFLKIYIIARDSEIPITISSDYKDHKEKEMYVNEIDMVAGTGDDAPCINVWGPAF